MADMIVPFPEREELENPAAAELSENDDLVEYIQMTSLESLRARFGEAEEDENIRSEGFGLAKKGGLLIKPHPESVIPYAGGVVSPQEDIKTEPEPTMPQVFDAAKSEHDSDNVLFSELSIDEPAEAQPAQEERKETVAEPETPPKRKRGRPRKVQPTEQETPVEETAKKDTPELEPEGEDYILVKKYKTKEVVIYVDESLDDGIKRNTETELESLFDNRTSGKGAGRWRRRKK